MNGEYIFVCQSCGEVFESDNECSELCPNCEKTKTIEKKCCKCSITYTTSDPFSLYCPECKKERDSTCEICGVPIDKKGNRRYCTECAKYIKNEGKKNDRELFRTRKAVSKSAEIRRAKRAERGGPTITEAVIEAQKLGISYGEYMEKYT